MKNPTSIAVDFDDSIASFLNGYSGLYEIFTRRGIPREKIIGFARDVAENQGFTIGRLVAHVKLRLNIGRLSDENRIADEFYERTRECLKPYPEVLDCMRKWRELGIFVEIVTKGDATYQKYKIDKIIQVPYDKIHCVLPPARKSEALRDILRRRGAPVLFIDNCADELDSVRDDGLSGEEVITCRIVRSEDHYGDGPARHIHRQISSFEEVLPKFFK